MKIMNNQDRPFDVRVIKQGERYGAENKLTHDKRDPLIEFWDLANNPNGIFVARYYASDIAFRDPDGPGLALDYGIPAWTIDAHTMLSVIDLARSTVRSLLQ